MYVILDHRYVDELRIGYIKEINKESTRYSIVSPFYIVII